MVEASPYLRAVDGDRAAVEAVVRDHTALVWRTIRAYRIDDATARDVHQTVWLRWFEHLRKARSDPERALRNPDALPGWLATVARNECMNVFRHRSRVTPDEIDERMLVYLPDTDERLERDDERRSFWEAFQKVSEGCRELLTLLMADPPIGYERIAEILGRPVGSVGPTRARCLEQLRKKL